MAFGDDHQPHRRLRPASRQFRLPAEHAGCGRGLALVEMARRFPNSEFVGYDLCPEAFEPTIARCREEGLRNIRFASRDLRDFDEPRQFDFIASFDAVHGQADPQALLNGISRSLRPDGVYLMQDIAGSSHLENNMNHPLGPLIYAISRVHCTPVSLGQGGPGLGTMWGEDLTGAFDPGNRGIRPYRHSQARSRSVQRLLHCQPR